MTQKLLYAIAGSVPAKVDGKPVLVLLRDIWFLNKENEALFVGSVIFQGLEAHKLLECADLDYEGIGTPLEFPRLGVDKPGSKV